MDLSLPDRLLKEFSARLDADADARSAFPGESGDRQPVHTMYGGAQIFRSDSASRLGETALKALETYAPDPATLATALGRPSSDPIIARLYPRVVEKLHREPVEDFRIDFEDGFGVRPDPEEDRAASQPYVYILVYLCLSCTALSVVNANGFGLHCYGMHSLMH